ncbi:MAG TPA: MoaD/ThiS family protein [Verrucomicrobiae bacterium]|nr:MoaD/ThiS family protein [Verrucomicrobiae bacterium]
MAVTVRVPGPLRTLTGGAAEVEVEGGTVAEALTNLDGRYPGFAARLHEPDGQLKAFVTLYRNDEDIRFADGLGTSLADGDDLSIVPAVAGGD